MKSAPRRLNLTVALDIGTSLVCSSTSDGMDNDEDNYANPSIGSGGSVLGTGGNAVGSGGGPALGVGGLVEPGVGGGGPVTHATCPGDAADAFQGKVAVIAGKIE